MSEEINFAKDLAIILISAGVLTIICRALKQPTILGYIIAGFIISPNLGLFPISSTEAVKQWSDIGIIFMMFGLGLEFSFKKLMKVGSGALVTAGAKFIGVFVIGFIAGQAMGWTSMESIFLAGLLSMSSTVVVIKSYGEMGLMKKSYAGIVFGTLVVEDLIAILLMVLLSTFAVAGKFSGSELVLGLAKLLFFLVLWFLIGIYVIPTVLKKTGHLINDEILLIVSVGLCFGMVTLATGAGFSSALGAFMMGSILAETVESERIDKLLLPIKDLFSAVFFVSVGMMISPAVILGHWGTILLLVVIVVLTHFLFAGLGVILSGGNLEDAVHTGLSLAQLGEFGFIIASVGVNLGVMREFIYPVIIAVSVITIFTTPYTIKAAGPVFRFLKEHLPASLLARIDHPEPKPHTAAEHSEWMKVMKPYLIRVALYSVILSALMIFSSKFLNPLIEKLLPMTGKGLRSIIEIAVTLAVMSPFLYGLGIASAGSLSEPAKKLIQEKRSNTIPILGLILVRLFIAISFVLAVISNHADLSWWTILLVIAAAIVLFLFGRHYMKSYDNIEKRFISNLNQKEDAARKKAPVTMTVRDKLGNYDVHIEDFTVMPDSMYIGQKLKEIPLRAESGANIIKITRGSKNIVIPNGEVQLFPYDRLIAVGTTSQLARLREMMSASVEKPEAGAPEPKFDVLPVTLQEDSYMTGQMLKELKLRDYGCMIISMLRGSDFTTNPKPDLVFMTGDIVWLAGDTSSLDWLKK